MLKRLVHACKAHSRFGVLHSSQAPALAKVQRASPAKAGFSGLCFTVTDGVGYFLPRMGRMFDSKKEVAPKRDFQWISCASFGLICVPVIVILAWGAEPAFLALIHPKAEDSYYNLLVQGFRAGQLNVKREAPPGSLNSPIPMIPPSTQRIYGIRVTRR